MSSRQALLMGFSLATLLLLASLPAAQAAGDPNPEVAEWTDAEYTLTVQPGFREVTLEAVVLIHEIDPPRNIQPICEVPCTADDIRRLYQDPRFSKEDVAGAIESSVSDRAKAALAAIAGQAGESQVDSEVSRESLEAPTEGDGFQPPIPVSVTGQAEIGLLLDHALSQGEVDALFAMGARASLPIQQTVAAGSNTTIQLSLPAPLAFLDAGSAQVTTGPDGDQIATWSITNWESAEPFQLDDPVEIGRDDVVVPEEEDVEISVTMDLSKIDVNYGNLIGAGPAASLDLAISLDASLQAIENPLDLQGPIELPLLSADALRIGLDAGLIERDQVLGFEHQARTGIRQAFADGFGKDVSVTGGLVNTTLEPNATGQPLGTGGPILMDMGARSQMDLPPGDDVAQGLQALTITTVELGEIPLPELALPGDRSATYTVILPQGIDLQFTGVTGGEIERTTTDDGRPALLFTSTGTGDERPTIQGTVLEVQHPIVWHLFWPVLLVLFLLLVVLPGGLIYYHIQKRRGKRDDGPHAWQKKSQAQGGGPAEDHSPVAGSRTGETQQHEGSPGSD